MVYSLIKEAKAEKRKNITLLLPQSDPGPFFVMEAFSIFSEISLNSISVWHSLRKICKYIS